MSPKMNKTITALSILFILVIVSSVSARPAKNQSLSRQKRQSDQRLAELETLLALQKYGRHRFRMDRKKGVDADREHPPGYGIIDFRVLGRKKKSTRFSSGELANILDEASLNHPVDYQQESWPVEENTFSNQSPNENIKTDDVVPQIWKY